MVPRRDNALIEEDRQMEDKAMNSFSQNMYKLELVKYYDLMHKYRNYDQESNFVDQIVQKFWPEANKILDIERLLLKRTSEYFLRTRF